MFPTGRKNEVTGFTKRYLPAHKIAAGGTRQLRPQTNNTHRQLQTVEPLIDTTPITGILADLQPITLRLVSKTALEALWDKLVSQYHYLGYQKLLGHRLKYLVFSRNRPVAALSWSAPALKIRTRDCFIGWSAEQRKNNLNRIANNSRFLILPWVQVPNLASHVLSLNIGQLNNDWQQHFHITLLLLETFVDPRYFKAISYKASNWCFVGQTQGSGKLRQGYVYHGAAKEVYVYVLNPEFRKIIDCKQKPCDLFHRPPQTLQKVEELKMLLKQSQWHPELTPEMQLTEQDVNAMADKLVEFHKQFHDCYGRLEHQRLGMAYLSGLMSNAKAKSVEPIALEFLNKHSVRSLQRFMKDYCWDHEGMQHAHQRMLSESVSDPNGMINTDSSEFVKKGKESVGVARQYCGSLGKTDNCQSGVFVGYASEKGYGLLTSRLYMPKIWFSQEYEQRRKYNLVPEDLSFKTKPQIALDLITQIVQTNLFPAKWIGCDATFGSDQSFLDALPEHMYYFADIRSTTNVFLEKPKTGVPAYKGTGPRPKKTRLLPGQPQPQAVAALAASKRLNWRNVVLAEGSKGPIVAQATCIRVYISTDNLPADNPVWLFIRRKSDGQLKFSISNAPENTPFEELCRASTLRWPIEQCFKEGKDQIGMDHYEHRSWPAWHRHMIFVFLALNLFLRLRIKFKKKTPCLTLAQARRLLTTMLPLKSINHEYALEIVKYHTQRNYIAYVSHRKKALRLAKFLNIQVSL